MKKISILSIFLLLTLFLIAYSFTYANFFIYFVLPSMSLWLFFGILFLLSKEKNIKICSIISIFLCILTIVPVCFIIFNVKTVNSEFVIHAGGGNKDYSYLNCKEIFIENVNKGQKLIELDFIYTSDNHVVCVHDFEFLKGFNFNNRPSLQDYENTLIAESYHGITFEWLINFLNENTNIKIIFDTKEEDNIKLINLMIQKSEEKSFDIKNRFIIQVYSKENYEELLTFNFNEYWFTNYKANYSPSHIQNYFGNKENVTTIVLHKTKWLLFKLINFYSNKKIAVHTLNDRQEIQFLSRRNVNYIFTDFC